MKRVFAFLSCLVLLIACDRGTRAIGYSRSSVVDDASIEVGKKNSSRLEISFVFQKQHGMSSNQFAVWIEDAHGVHIKTLCVTRWTAERGWKIWPVLLPDWRKDAQPQNMSPETIDAFSGATPLTGILAYTWDCKNDDDKMVPPGEYRYFIEGNLRWASRVLYTGKVVVGGPARQSQGEFDYFGDDEAERVMITQVIVKYHPGNGDNLGPPFF
jgi:hypothetical protein